MANPVGILVVDDETPQMQAICDTLRDQDYAPTGFSSGQAALEVLQPGKFQILLADLMMPGMDGIALLQAALRKDPDLMGIIMTGAGTIATAVEAMKAGAFDYLLKPFKLSAMLPVLSRALAVRRLRLENAELQRRIHQRTVELEAANKELETFSYSVSHDLRAPLRAMCGFAEILASEHAQSLPDDAKKLLARIEANSTRMEQLIEDLLRFSHLGRKSLAKAPVDIAAIVNTVVEDKRAEYPNRSIEVKIGQLPETLGDQSLIKQVYVNLLSNAFKFTAPREQALIEVGSREEDGECIYFVRDNGVGFDMKHAGNVFGVFERLHSDKDFPGTGIGLSIVQRIVQRHGGRIWIEAAVDKGAVFFFTFSNKSEATSTTPVPSELSDHH
jgi:signal transduction histidine kinase